MSMKIFALRDRRPASLRDTLTRAKLPVLMIAAATFQLTGNEAISQSNCDVVKIAEDFARTRWPTDLTTNRRVVVRLVSVAGSIYQRVTFNLPDGYLGPVPEITVDGRSCWVIGAKLWQ
jgi:hypothetical protein